MRIGLERIRSIRPGVCALLLLPLGCSPVTVNTSTAPSEAFSTRHTYAWETNPQIGGALDDLIVGQDIHAAVNQALEARGFRRADGEPPDFLVDYRVKLHSESEIEGSRWQMEEHRYTEGTLFVALVDPKSKLILWRGAAEAAVDPSTDGAGQWQDIHNAVRQMLANFPS
jgi:hypothetical protein